MRIIQLPLWKVEDIISSLDSFKECGFNAVQTFPINPCKEEIGWRGFYQPYSTIKVGNSLYNEENLKLLCEEAHKRGLLVFIDAIFTHVSNKPVYNSLEPNDKVDERLTSNAYFWKEKKQINYNDRNSVISHCNGMPSIRVDNYDYIDLVIDYIDYLTEVVHIDGMRWDSCKMISLPEENGNNFIPRVLEGIVKNDLYVYGELIFEGQELLSKYQKYINVLVNLSDAAYRVDRNKEVVFVESHDSFYENSGIGHTSRLTNEQVIKNYEYLCQDFVNTLFFNRPDTEMWKMCKLIHEEFNK